MYFITILFLYDLNLYIHVNATSIGDISFDVINVKNKINCNGEMFCKPKRLALLVSSFIQPCGSHFIKYLNE